MIHQASFLNIFGAAHDCPTLLQLESDQLTMRRGRGTDVDTVQEVKELLDTIFTMPSLPTLDPLRAVLEMLCGCAARCVLALFADTRGGLASVSEVAPPRFKRRRRLEIGNDETVSQNWRMMRWRGTKGWIVASDSHLQAPPPRHPHSPCPRPRHPPSPPLHRPYPLPPYLLPPSHDRPHRPWQAPRRMRYRPNIQVSIASLVSS